LSSTSSSVEQEPPRRSATETLASRYRHLFVLPSTLTLLFYSAVASFLLGFASKGTNGVASSLLTFFIFILSAAVISNALLLADRRSIADFRRICGVLLAGDVLWIIFVACGVVFAWLTGSAGAFSNVFLFGAFVSAGLEFLVIDGVFTERSWLAVTLAAIHPAVTLVILRFAELSLGFDPLPIFFGVLAYAIVATFIILLKRRKTSEGHSALGLFRAFMKTWVGGEAADLERIIASHSEETQVTTKVVRFQTKAGDVFLVLPGVHPGPFYPVGSYDLPGVISKTFKGQGTVMTFHRPGGHERNLATREETDRYAEETSRFAQTISLSAVEASVRGPIQTRIGNANVSATAFFADMILTVSFAPLGSDDLNAGIETELSGPASAAGFEATAIDAHNSLEDHQESVDSADPGWIQLFERMKLAEAMPFRVGYAHSNEFGFGAREDLTENGIGLIMFETAHSKSVLVLADANNAIPSLRAEIAKALSPLGYELIEFCTSDSHNLAARGLTVSRGYRALGEATPVESLVKLVVDIAKLAETRLSQSSYGSGLFTSTVKVFGAKALEEFAVITQSSSALARRYFRFAAVSVAILLILSLVL
jgi:putative membrane protein